MAERGGCRRPAPSRRHFLAKEIGHPGGRCSHRGDSGGLVPLATSSTTTTTTTTSAPAAVGGERVDRQPHARRCSRQGVRHPPSHHGGEPAQGGGRVRREDGNLQRR